MEPKASLHPADETLVSYGLGQLDETVAGTVSQHLEQCAPCRQRVAELSSDSFVGRLREAQPRQAEVPERPRTIVETEPYDRARARNPGKQVAIPEEPASSKLPSEAMPSEASGSLPPELVNHPQYEVIRELGRGGMGVVYLVHNKLMDRLEVLKLLSQEMLGKQERVDRFLREIQSAAKLHHPNVVAAHTAFPMGKMLVLAMEYVEGDDLAKLVRARGPLPVLNACYFAYQTAQGLQHAHERGMIHRDIKPGNLILFRQGKKGTVKILDFGLAKVTSEQKIDGALTQQGQMLGTPDYIAPEQTLDAQKADIRSDIYSLGCTLYHLLTGNPPFSGNTLYAVLQAHHAVEAKSVNLVRPEVPVELAAVVAKMMAKEPSRRYQTPAEVAQALKPFLKPGGLTSRQPELEPDVSPLDRPSATPVPAALPMPDESEHPFLAPMPEVEPSERWKSLIDTPSLTPSGALPAIRKSLQRSPKWLWATTGITCVLLAGLIIAWAAGALRVKTKDGVIVIENLPEQASVYVDGEIVTLRPAGDGRAGEITVRTGDHRVEVKKGDVTVSGENVNIANSDRKPLRIRLEPGKPISDEPVSGIASARPIDLQLRQAYQSSTGVWTIDGNELVQELEDGDDCTLAFGDFTWKDYDFACEGEKIGGRGEIGIVYHVTNNGRDELILGRWDGTFESAGSMDSEGYERLKWRKTSELQDGRWYKLRVRIRGARFQLFVDDKQVFEIEVARNPQGAVGLRTWNTAARFRNLRVTDSSGKLLFEGLPKLPATKVAWIRGS
jgi:serine/threonine protein kinase